MSSYEDLRRRQVADMVAAMPGYVARLDWSRAELERHRRRALRLLLRVAKEHSPWWRERLREIDPAAATEDDLERIPPMTRDDLMDHWDEILIYPSLRLAQVEAHLDEAKADAYLFDTFHAVRSGGACGRPGVLLYDWEGWIASYSGCARWRLRNREGTLGSRQPRVAMVASERPTHISSAINQTFSLGSFHRLPAATPLDELVRGLNELDPAVLIGYPSVLRALCEEARSGRLRIRPASVNCSGEPLSREVRAELASTWGSARVHNGWTASEALPLAQSCGIGTSMHLNDDLAVVEPVDLFGRRVQPGFRSAKVYVTNLFNLALPLIRYELTDQVVPSTESCRCGSAHTRIDEVSCRLDDRFVYDDGVVVEPGELDSVLKGQSVFEYQVRQTDDGAEVRVRCDQNLHLRAVGHRVASALGKRGLPRPTVSVRRVEQLERGPAGKLQRFIPRSA